MFFYEMLLAIVLAAIVVAILAPGRRYRGTSGGAPLLFFFLLLFPLIWAAGAWLTPIGPVYAGVAWAGFVVAALFFLLLLFALAPPPAPPHTTGVTHEDIESEGVPGAAVAFGIFFWILLIAAIVALFFAYW